MPFTQETLETFVDGIRTTNNWGCLSRGLGVTSTRKEGRVRSPNVRSNLNTTQKERSINFSLDPGHHGTVQQKPVFIWCQWKRRVPKGSLVYSLFCTTHDTIRPGWDEGLRVTDSKSGDTRRGCHLSRLDTFNILYRFC